MIIVSTDTRIETSDTDFQKEFDKALAMVLAKGGELEVFKYPGKSIKKITVEYSATSLQGRKWEYIHPGQTFALGAGVDLEILKNGDLKVTPTDWIVNEWSNMTDEDWENLDEISTLLDIFDSYMANGWEWYSLGYGDAPIIAYDATLLDDGKWLWHGPMWKWESWQVRSLVEELFKKGEAVLTLVDTGYDCACEAECSCECRCNDLEEE